jgi:hypothetical protein
MNPQSILNELNNAYNALQFNEEYHAYTVKGEQLTPVTTYLKRFVKPFVSHQAASAKAKSTGVSKDYYLRRWKLVSEEALALGKRIHLFMEYMSPTNPASDGYEQSVVAFFTDLYEEVIAKEMKCYYKGLAGTVDLITLNEDGTLNLYDFKTGNIHKEGMSKMLAPFDSYKETAINKYSIQLHLYKWIIEKTTSFKVSKCTMVHITQDGYELIEAKDFTQQLLEEKENRLVLEVKPNI